MLAGDGFSGDPHKNSEASYLNFHGFHINPATDPLMRLQSQANCEILEHKNKLAVI